MSEILSYLCESAMLYRRTGVNSYGEDVRDAGREVYCRVRRRRLAAQLKEAEETGSSGEVWLAPDESVSPGDAFLYDGDYLTVTAVSDLVDIAGTLIGRRAEVR